jgi:hypothetical protein
MITIQGQEIKTRASSLYPQLDNLDWLYRQLLERSMAELADDLGIPHNSRNVVRYRVEKYFPEEWKDNIKRERKRHTKVRRKG